MSRKTRSFDVTTARYVPPSNEISRTSRQVSSIIGGGPGSSESNLPAEATPQLPPEVVVFEGEEFAELGEFVDAAAEGSDNAGTRTEIQVTAPNLLMLAFHSDNSVSGGITASTWFDGPGAEGATTQALTFFDEEHDSNDHDLELWYKYNPLESLNGNSGVTASSADGRFAHAVLLYEGLTDASILGSETSFGPGTTTTRTQTMSSLVQGQRVVAVLAYHNDLDGAPDTPDGWTHRTQAQGAGTHEAAIHVVEMLVPLGADSVTVEWGPSAHIGDDAGDGWTIMMVLLEGGSVEVDSECVAGQTVYEVLEGDGLTYTTTCPIDCILYVWFDGLEAFPLVHYTVESPNIITNTSLLSGTIVDVRYTVAEA